MNKNKLKKRIKELEDERDSYGIKTMLAYVEIEELKQQLTLTDVVSSLPSKDEKLIENMCLSFRHDFGLLPKLIQDDLKRDCKNWLIAYENNRN